MKKLMKQAVQTVRIFCFLGLALQVLLGLWYLVMNIDAWRDVLQVMLALGATYYGARSIFSKEKAVFTALIINTIPFVAQAHLASYIYSVIFSITILAIACCKVQYTKNKSKHIRRLGIVLAFIFPIVMFTTSITGEDFSNLKSAIGMTAVERFAWPHLDGIYKQWMPEEVLEVFTDGDLTSVSIYPYRVESEWQPTMEAALGVDKAFEVNLAVAHMGLEQCTLLNVQNILLDTISYASPYAVLDKYLSGRVISATSFNFQLFRERTPELATKYFWITYRLLGCMLFLTVPCIIYALNKKQRMTYLKNTALLGFYFLYVGFILSLQGTDCFDYKQSLLQISVYYLPIIYFIEVGDFKNKKRSL
ncbi:MAG: hypothetical protein R3Y47_02865 [Lachnospiraceae bacterium]